MKKSFISFALISLIVWTSAQAGSIYDPFLTGGDYSLGQYTNDVALGGQNPTISGFTGAWPTDASSTPPNTLVTNSGLTYATGSISLGLGGAVRQQSVGSDTDVYTGLRSTTGLATRTGNGEVWFAGLFRADSDNSGDDFNYISVNPDAGTFGFGILGGGDSVNRFYVNGATITGTDYTSGTTALFIVRLSVTNFNASATAEVLDFWINPTDSSSVAQLNATAQATATQGTNITIGTWLGTGLSMGVSFNTSSGQGRVVDELLAADTLADLNALIAIPEPSALTLAGLGLLGLLVLRRRFR
jgi:hypothetical protein